MNQWARLLFTSSINLHLQKFLRQRINPFHKMSYQQNMTFDFGSSASLTLNGKLLDANGALQGSVITSGFVNLGNGSYSYLATIPSLFVGSFIAYSAGDATIDATLGINVIDDPNYRESTIAQSPTGDLLSDLKLIQRTYAAELAKGNVKPNYNLEGQSVSWTDWRTAMIQSIKDVNELILLISGPFEITTEGIP